MRNTRYQMCGAIDHSVQVAANSSCCWKYGRTLEAVIKLRRVLHNGLGAVYSCE